MTLPTPKNHPMNPHVPGSPAHLLWHEAAMADLAAKNAKDMIEVHKVAMMKAMEKADDFRFALAVLTRERA